MSIFNPKYERFLTACAALGVTVYEIDTPKGAACWDAAYMVSMTKCQYPDAAVCQHCISGAKYMTTAGHECTAYEYACYMSQACSAIGMIEDSALYARYADSIRPESGVIRL